MKILTRASLARLAVLLGLLGVPATVAWAVMIRMPGESFRGALAPLTEEEGRLRDELRRDVERLATGIGERNFSAPEKLEAAARFIEGALREAGCEPRRHVFTARMRDYANIEADAGAPADPRRIVVLGAHYDSAVDTPGANDNGTGVAALLAIARRLASRPAPCALRLVFFANEEPPFFQTDGMGSLAYARRCRERGEDIRAMLSLETIGCYSDVEGSQQYPFPFGLLYPSRGNFAAFVGDVGSRALVRAAVGSFRRHARFPSEGAALPSRIPGVAWSDHWSFSQCGYPAVMVTDTAPFRYRHYHEPTDRPAEIDFDRTARVVSGLVPVIEDLLSAFAP